ncbi:hypothetical protein Klosneuvirus_3_161 [Klosneuvirus KNV1]|uniref:Uncharacterized protein n=1 Tax=Klosneuvirus KNV1 TaxID=1977640 RepID=A0A1V0SJX9_9VIRU|nr:hypothetical protein Klosneuvirus_3_161 [Klosneuvirus KNV1]
MEPDREMPSYYTRIPNFIVGQGHTIFGSYVYKSLVNGDVASDIDVRVPEEKWKELKEQLESTFQCVESNRPSDEYRKRQIRWTYSMNCPNNDPLSSQFYRGQRIDFTHPQKNQNYSPDMFKLQYKEVGGKPMIVHSDGDNEKCKKVVSQLRRREFVPWEGMRYKDKEYFNQPIWTDASTFRYKFKNMFRKDE